MQIIVNQIAKCFLNKHSIYYVPGTMLNALLSLNLTESSQYYKAGIVIPI